MHYNFTWYMILERMKYNPFDICKTCALQRTVISGPSNMTHGSDIKWHRMTFLWSYFWAYSVKPYLLNINSWELKISFFGYPSKNLKLPLNALKKGARFFTISTYRLINEVHTLLVHIQAKCMVVCFWIKMISYKVRIQNKNHFLLLAMSDILFHWKSTNHQQQWLR